MLVSLSFECFEHGALDIKGKTTRNPCGKVIHIAPIRVCGIGVMIAAVGIWKAFLAEFILLYCCKKHSKNLITSTNKTLKSK